MSQIQPVVKTALGELQGREKDGVQHFFGVPYAAPPTGARRFRAPQAHGGWTGVRDAQRPGPAAPQPREEGLTSNPNVRWDEDCLTLNVTTPAADGARRPVLFWIHGGGFRTGQGAIPWYNGSSFARRGDVVTVSINYRLGALGFAQLGALGSEETAGAGMNGILDQIAALRFVRENIAAFGGDPDRVTIAGESAGAMSVGVLLGCPSAAGLFRGAILQSGAAHRVLTKEQGEQVGRRFAEALGARSLAELEAAPAERVLDAQRAVEDASRRGELATGLGLAGMPFQPVVEGRALPRPPIDAIRAGLAARVAVLCGTNRDEMTLFGLPDVDDDGLARAAARIFADAPAALAAYRREWPGATPSALRQAIMTDAVFRLPALRLLEAHGASGGTGHAYLFSWPSRAFGGRLGATHALEIPFAFGTLGAPGVSTFLGPGAPPEALSAAMHEAWTAFVRDGAPAAAAFGDWPSYTASRRAVMELGESSGLRSDPGGATRALWDGVL